jgi:hypothetical protein
MTRGRYLRQSYILSIATEEAAEGGNAQQHTLEEGDADEGCEGAKQYVDDVMVAEKLGKRILFFHNIWRIGTNILLLQHE